MLLRVPLLPLLPLLQLAEQRLPVGLVQLHDALQLLHEQQLQHALVRVQVGQLEQLPLEDVVVPRAQRRGYSGMGFGGLGMARGNGTAPELQDTGEALKGPE